MADTTFKSKKPLLYCLSLVKRRQSTTVRRGAEMRAMAIATRHQFLHVYKPLLVLALDRYFDAVSGITPSSTNPTNRTSMASDSSTDRQLKAYSVLAHLYDSINAMDLTSIPYLSENERLLLRHAEAFDIFGEKFEELEGAEKRRLKVQPLFSSGDDQTNGKGKRKSGEMLLEKRSSQLMMEEAAMTANTANVGGEKSSPGLRVRELRGRERTQTSPDAMLNHPTAAGNSPSKNRHSGDLASLRTPPPAPEGTDPIRPRAATAPKSSLNVQVNKTGKKKRTLPLPPTPINTRLPRNFDTSSSSTSPRPFSAAVPATQTRKRAVSTPPQSATSENSSPSLTRSKSDQQTKRHSWKSQIEQVETEWDLLAGKLKDVKEQDDVGLTRASSATAVQELVRPKSALKSSKSFSKSPPPPDSPAPPPPTSTSTHKRRTSRRKLESPIRSSSRTAATTPNSDIPSFSDLSRSRQSSLGKRASPRTATMTSASALAQVCENVEAIRDVPREGAGRKVASPTTGLMKDGMGLGMMDSANSTMTLPMSASETHIVLKAATQAAATAAATHSPDTSITIPTHSPGEFPQQVPRRRSSLSTLMKVPLEIPPTAHPDDATYISTSTNAQPRRATSRGKSRRRSPETARSMSKLEGRRMMEGLAAMDGGIKDDMTGSAGTTPVSSTTSPKIPISTSTTTANANTPSPAVISPQPHSSTSQTTEIIPLQGVGSPTGFHKGYRKSDESVHEPSPTMVTLTRKGSNSASYAALTGTLGESLTKKDVGPTTKQVEMTSTSSQTRTLSKANAELTVQVNRKERPSSGSSWHEPSLSVQSTSSNLTTSVSTPSNLSAILPLSSTIAAKSRPLQSGNTSGPPTPSSVTGSGFLTPSGTSSALSSKAANPIKKKSFKNRQFYETKVVYEGLAIPIRIPLTYVGSPEEVGDFSVINLINKFFPQHPAKETSSSHTYFPPPYHPELHTNGGSTNPIMLLLNAMLTEKRILFLGHGMPSREVAQLVLAACAMGSGNGFVLRGLTERAFPYTSLANLDTLLNCPGYIAGVTNIIFEEKPQWWDILCNCVTGKITVSSRVRLRTGSFASMAPMYRTLMSRSSGAAMATVASATNMVGDGNAGSGTVIPITMAMGPRSGTAGTSSSVTQRDADSVSTTSTQSIRSSRPPDDAQLAQLNSSSGWHGNERSSVRDRSSGTGKDITGRRKFFSNITEMFRKGSEEKIDVDLESVTSKGTAEVDSMSQMGSAFRQDVRSPPKRCSSLVTEDDLAAVKHKEATHISRLAKVKSPKSTTDLQAKSQEQVLDARDTVKVGKARRIKTTSNHVMSRAVVMDGEPTSAKSPSNQSPIPAAPSTPAPDPPRSDAMDDSLTSPLWNPTYDYGNVSMDTDMGIEDVQTAGMGLTHFVVTPNARQAAYGETLASHHPQQPTMTRRNQNRDKERDAPVTKSLQTTLRIVEKVSERWPGDAEFMQDVITAILGHRGELVIRAKFQEYLERMVEVAAVFERQLYGETLLGSAGQYASKTKTQNVVEEYSFSEDSSVLIPDASFSEAMSPESQRSQLGRPSPERRARTLERNSTLTETDTDDPARTPSRPSTAHGLQERPHPRPMRKSSSGENVTSVANSSTLGYPEVDSGIGCVSRPASGGSASSRGSGEIYGPPLPGHLASQVAGIAESHGYVGHPLAATGVGLERLPMVGSERINAPKQRSTMRRPSLDPTAIPSLSRNRKSSLGDASQTQGLQPSYRSLNRKAISAEYECPVPDSLAAPAVSQLTARSESFSDLQTAENRVSQMGPGLGHRGSIVGSDPQINQAQWDSLLASSKSNEQITTPEKETKSKRKSRVKLGASRLGFLPSLSSSTFLASQAQSEESPLNTPTGDLMFANSGATTAAGMAAIMSPREEVALGYGPVFSDKVAEQRELLCQGAKFLAWRGTISYRYYQRDLQHRLDRKSVKDVDVQHQIWRLRGSTMIDAPNLILMYESLLKHVVKDEDIIELLSYLNPHNGGLVPLASGLFHVSPEVKRKTVQILRRIDKHPVGKKFVERLNGFFRRTYERYASDMMMLEGASALDI